MAQVKGIGGAFLASNNAARLAAWYAETLGIVMEAHPNGTSFYHVFRTRDPESGVRRENPVLAINQAEQSVPAGGCGFILNLRVDDLDGFLALLSNRGVAVEGRILVWERGKHARIRDLDHNLIELYEELLPATTAG